MSYDTDSDVDYKADDIAPATDAKISFWQQPIFVMLVFVVLVSFAIIVFQLQQVARLTDQNEILRATVEAMQQLLTATPTP